MANTDKFPILYEASLLRNIIHNAFIGIVETDLNFTIRLANPAAREMLNDQRNIIGMSMSDLVKESSHLQEVGQALATESLQRHDSKWTPSQTEYHTEFKMLITLSRDDEYKIAGFLLMLEKLVYYTVCCMCRKVQTPDGWIPIEELINRSSALSHTYCPDCMPGAMEKVIKAIQDRGEGK